MSLPITYVGQEAPRLAHRAPQMPALDRSSAEPDSSTAFGFRPLLNMVANIVSRGGSISQETWNEIDKLAAQWMASGHVLPSESVPEDVEATLLQAYWKEIDNRRRQIEPGDPTMTLSTLLRPTGGTATQATALAEDVKTKDIPVEDVERAVQALRYDDDESYFRLSDQLLTLLERNGNAVVDALEEVKSDRKIPSWKLGEALQLLGTIEHARTYQARRDLLVKCLEDPQAAVRGGGISGLIELGDTALSPRLIERCREREAVPELRKSLTKLLNRLG